MEKLLITIGSAGAALVEDGRFVLSPSVPGVKAIDPTAAGDSFVGAICVAVCSGLSSEDALRFAQQDGEPVLVTGSLYLVGEILKTSAV